MDVLENDSARYNYSQYRRDIQGIRAIGAILILVYHIWGNKVSGGVDVFFVVSGFLMTSLILKQYVMDGTINPFQFWAKIIKRIAPAAYVVLMSTMVLAYFFLPPPFWLEFVNEVIASAVYLENIQLIRKSVDYLAADTPASPVQQFWALSIQMQFYIAIPLLISLGVYLSRFFVRLRESVLLPVFILFLASFLCSIFLTSISPETSYFNPVTRAWEFLAGSLVAIVIPWIKISEKTSSYLAITGFLGLLFGGIIIPASLSYPGYIALFPVISAVFLIISGFHHNKSHGIINRILSSRVMVALGGVSFTIYLWHWPLVVYFQHHTGSIEIGVVAGLVIIAASFFLAFLTSLVIEAPFKAFHGNRLMTSWLVGLIFFLPVFAGGFAWRGDVLTTQQEHAKLWRNKDVIPFLGDSIHVQNDARMVSKQDLISAHRILPRPYDYDCHQTRTNSEVTTCEFGDLEGQTVMVLVGGSHALQWLPALSEFGKSNSMKIINITKSACALGVLPSSNSSCISWNEQVLDVIASFKPQVVLTNSTRADGEYGVEYVPEGYVKQWEKLRDLGIPLIGIRDNPWFDFDIPTCISKNLQHAYLCAKPRSKALLDKDPATEYPNLIVSVDLSDLLCNEDICPTFFEGYLMYRDRHHVSVPYAMFLREKLAERLINTGLFEAAN
jgi:peptidoglycan/LPS O-acetylase OafA/YrhL